MTAPRSSVQTRRQLPLKNMSLDEFERCSKSFTMHNATVGPHDLLFLPRGMVVLRNGFEQVRHLRVQGLSDPGPSTCQGTVPVHVCNGLYGAGFRQTLRRKILPSSLSSSQTDSKPFTTGLLKHLFCSVRGLCARLGVGFLFFFCFFFGMHAQLSFFKLCSRHPGIFSGLEDQGFGAGV